VSPAAAPADPDVRELTVEVTGARYRAPEEDFAVLDALTEAGEEVVLTGPVAHVGDGEALAVGGAWRRHERHGWQFAVDRVRLLEPVSERAVLGQLEAVRHVGPRGVRVLLERHGAGEVLAAVDRDPEAVLGAVPGIGPRRLAGAVRSWREQAAVREVRLFLDTHGVDAAAAARIARHVGSGAVEQLRRDPYSVCELDGIGFATADALARALGTPADDPGRLAAGVLHALAEAESDGHCHLPRAGLLARAGRLLGTDELDAAIAQLAARGRVEEQDGRVAEARLAAVERRLARHVCELLADQAVLDLADPERPDGTGGGFEPSDDQWRAVQQALAHRLSILTGGPGTGKTQTMRALVDVVEAGRRRVRLCAPTGKAARRLGELTGAEATTVHRLLEWAPHEGPGRDADHPIDGCDVLIVDEASMLSVRVAEALLAAVGPRTHVLLVGDVDQLPPVGPGRVLEDLIDSGEVPATRLHDVFRQAARSLIVRAAHALNRGDLPPTVAGPGDVRDFYVVACETPEEIVSEVCALATARLPAHFGLDPTADVQVLAPMHRGPVGVDALNGELRARLNADGAPIPGTALRVGDRVMQTRNSYEHDLFNGERGVLVHHDAERDRALFAGDDGRRLTLPDDALGTLRLAYASSVHKAQGSQARAVIVPLFTGHRIMLTRNLLYTAVTRAQEVCVLVGQTAALGIALRRTDARLRHTRLRALIAD
jgi:exodeoxyribonuclease V alpha subunit